MPSPASPSPPSLWRVAQPPVRWRRCHHTRLRPRAAAPNAFFPVETTPALTRCRCFARPCSASRAAFGLLGVPALRRAGLRGSSRAAKGYEPIPTPSLHAPVSLVAVAVHTRRTHDWVLPVFWGAHVMKVIEIALGWLGGGATGVGGPGQLPGRGRGREKTGPLHQPIPPGHARSACHRATETLATEVACYGRRVPATLGGLGRCWHARGHGRGRRRPAAPA